MILRDRRLPLVVGVLLLTGLAWGIYQGAPNPAPLSSPHAQVPGLMDAEGCATCHTPQGLTKGCLDCHGEIQNQLSSGNGYHSWLMDSEAPNCTSCHPEHFGQDFPLISSLSWGQEVVETFDHPHVDFALIDAHAELQCDDCHVGKRQGASTLPDYPEFMRAHTFLGLDQSCATCHDDPHAGGLARCSDCHDQKEFAHSSEFDHDAHFELVGAHAEASCTDCHPMPAGDDAHAKFPFPFHQVKGKACDECHNSPHQFAFGESCDACHSPAHEQGWLTGALAMTPERHAKTGFDLVAPHAQLDCAQCHAADLPFADRHPAPASLLARHAHSCQDCHEDIHKGQFLAQGKSCLDCHDPLSFHESGFDRDHHATFYPLTGSHAALECAECHTMDDELGARRFVGTAKECRSCHESPHLDQFARTIADQDCTACHSSHSDTFDIQHFDHGPRTGFELTGAHARTDCRGCHGDELFEFEGKTVTARRFEGTPRDCTSCHEDVHAGQFQGRYASCLDCHDGDAFHPTAFTHAAHERHFELTGAHGAIACTECHVPHGPEQTRRFVGTPQSCRECHNDPHAGQFRDEIAKNDCRACHEPHVGTFEIRPFDHELRTGYALEGAHAEAGCNDCHREIEFRRGDHVGHARRYIGLSQECASCHNDVHRGQFADYESCSICHTSVSDWKEGLEFDHQTQSRFPLEGAHLTLECSKCHKPTGDREEKFVQFKPLGTECRDCHDIDPRTKKRR